MVSLLAAIASIYFSHRSQSLAERTARLAYLERVRDWAESTVDIVIAIRRACRNGCSEEEFRDVDVLRTRLSAQIEKGRWFFPNQLAERVGQKKEAAYRGLRQPVLDQLVLVYDAVDGLRFKERSKAQHELWAATRAFVSEIQAVLDPNRDVQTYALLVDRYKDLEEKVDAW